MFELKDIVTVGQKPKPPRIILYGSSKIGKNTWCAGAPAPIVLQAEEGSNELGTPRLPLATSFDQLLEYIKMLCEQKHEYQTLIVDSLDWIERVIWAHHCRLYDKKDIEAFGYAKGYVQVLTHWNELKQALDYLRDEKGMTIICICHHEVKTHNLPDCDPFDRYQPKLHKHVQALVREWSDAILFAGYQVYTKTVGDGPKEVTKGVGTGERVLRCTETAQWLAGNRYDLPATLPFPKVGGYQIFQDHVTKFFSTNQAMKAATNV